MIQNLKNGRKQKGIYNKIKLDKVNQAHMKIIRKYSFYERYFILYFCQFFIYMPFVL